MASLPTPIWQFGTSRFLQAHVGLFVSQALERGEALGGITVVQTTDNPASAARVAALAGGAGYDVLVRGLREGHPVDERVRCTGVHAACNATADWPMLREAFAGDAVRVVVSNTADAGWRPDPRDGPGQLREGSAPPGGFPAKLLVLLHARWRKAPDAPLTILPCELVSRNGEQLRDCVAALAASWLADPGFQQWLQAHPAWVNSLVDRIVPEALEPVGAVAEPYALWAVERQPRMELPCRHPAIEVADDLGRHERLKLWLLNLGHTLLAHLWLRERLAPGFTVLQAMQSPTLRTPLEQAWQSEVLPVFAAHGEADVADRYLAGVRDRFMNPWLAHRLADIATHHATKVVRRVAPVVEAATRLTPGLAQPLLRSVITEAAAPEQGRSKT